MRPNLG
jgi:ATP-binding cassette, sub-family E, member 1